MDLVTRIVDYFYPKSVGARVRRIMKDFKVSQIKKFIRHNELPNMSDGPHRSLLEMLQDKRESSIDDMLYDYELKLSKDDD